MGVMLQQVQIIEGEHKHNYGIIVSEIPDKEGFTQVAIEDVIVMIPVGYLRAVVQDSFLGNVISIAQGNIQTFQHLLNLNTATPQGWSELPDRSLDSFPKDPSTMFGLAYLVTAPAATTLAQQVLEDSEVNIQRFWFEELEKQIIAYEQSHPTL